MTAKKIKKEYTIDYQVVEGAVLDNVQTKIDKAFDILFDFILESEKEVEKSIDTCRQQGVYCNYGISNKKRGCEIL
jgi:hypothetical protein